MHYIYNDIAAMKPCLTPQDCVALYRNSETWTCRNAVCVCTPDPCSSEILILSEITMSITLHPIIILL